MKTKIITAFVAIIFVTNIMAQSSYVKVNCNNFELNGIPFQPLVCNYLTQFTKDYNNNTYYLSPNWNYSDNWGYPNTGGPGRFIYSSTDDKGVSITKVGKDMARIKNMGFNTIRVFVQPDNNNGVLEVPTGSYTSYFSIIDQLLDSANTYDLKVILVVGPKKSWEIHASFKSYLEIISNHFKNNSTILGYDLYNEPFNDYSHNNVNDKYKISNWVSEWCHTIRKHDINHLITIGLTHPENSIAWDPLVMPIDFVSFHFYAWTENLQTSKDRIQAYLYWASRTIKMPWIIGEIGYSGTNTFIIDPDALVGSENDQANFATTTMQKSLDCNCQGYSWWQYQEINWQNPWEDYLGLINNYGPSGFANETNKQAASVFSSYSSMSGNASNCTKPSNYYNIYNYSNIDLTGRVLDNWGIPVKNAVIIGWKNVNGNWPYYITYSDDNGYFILRSNTPGYNIQTLWISLPGYSTVKASNPISGLNYSIKPINFNRWTKKWTNDANNKIDGWYVLDTDQFFFADFDGNGQDELLCTQNKNTGNNYMTMLYYNNSSADWDWGWSNSGNGWIGPWYKRNIDRFFTGDFNGDGKSDLLCMQVTNNNTDWWSLLKFNNNQWSYLTNNSYNSGSDWIGSWQIRSIDEFYVGDFNGDGKDDLFCIQKTNNNTDWFSILTFNPVSGLWDYLYINGIPITNYGSDWFGSWKINSIDKYYVGDFNGDGRSEILCTQYTGGSNDWMALNKLNLSNGTFQRIWCNCDNGILYDDGIYPYRNKLIVGNFDDDSKDEILGIHTWGTKFDFESNDFQWSWSTGNGGIFSDWQVSPSGEKYFFTKTYKYSPEQLMSFKKIGSNYLINMYSFNKVIECSTLRKFNHTDYPNNSEINIINDVDTILNVFPNPTNGKIYISFDSDSNSGTLITIINNKGEIVRKTYLDYKSSIDNIEIDIDMKDLSEGMYFIKVINGKFAASKKIIYLKK